MGIIFSPWMVTWLAESPAFIWGPEMGIVVVAGWVLVAGIVVIVGWVLVTGIAVVGVCWIL